MSLQQVSVVLKLQFRFFAFFFQYSNSVSGWIAAPQSRLYHTFGLKKNLPVSEVALPMHCCPYQSYCSDLSSYYDFKSNSKVEFNFGP